MLSKNTETQQPRTTNLGRTRCSLARLSFSRCRPSSSVVSKAAGLILRWTKGTASTRGIKSSSPSVFSFCEVNVLANGSVTCSPFASVRANWGVVGGVGTGLGRGKGPEGSCKWEDKRDTRLGSDGPLLDVAAATPCTKMSSWWMKSSRVSSGSFSERDLKTNCRGRWLSAFLLRFV